MAQHTVRGGRQRGESKEQMVVLCPICHQEVSKRQSRQVERNGEFLRICKRHPSPEKA